MRRTWKLIVTVLVIASVIALGGCSESEANAMTRVAGYFMIAVITGDGGLLQETVPVSITQEHPEFFSDLEDRADIETDYEWSGDVLIVSFGGEEARLEPIEAEEPSVVGTFPDGTQTLIVLENTADGWRVIRVDDLSVAELLQAVTADIDTLGASVEQDACFAGQMTIELAAETLVMSGGALTTETAAYIPSYLEEPIFCPNPDSQYSSINSDGGFIEGIGADGLVAPCSVHGYYNEAE